MQETKKIAPSHQRTISIRSIPGGFSFSTSTSKGNVLKELKMPAIIDFPERFEDFVQSRGWAERENLPITMIDFSNHFMLLPSDITEEDQIKAFFNLLYPHEEENQIYSAPLCDEKQNFCWEIPISRDHCFERLFPNLNMLSSAYLLANWCIREATLKQQPTLVAHLYGKIMHVFAADTQRLIFANTFPVNNHEEMPYFLLRVMEQLLLSSTQTRCVLCLEKVSELDIMDIFSPYIQQLETATFTHQVEEPISITGKKQ